MSARNDGATVTIDVTTGPDTVVSRCADGASLDIEVAGEFRPRRQQANATQEDRRPMMKDALGRDIVVGQALAYASRQGSSHSVYVAIVDEIVDEPATEDRWQRKFVRVTVVAGTSGMRWDAASRSWVAQTARKTTIRRTDNAIILDGVDVDALRCAALQTR